MAGTADGAGVRGATAGALALPEVLVAGDVDKHTLLLEAASEVFSNGAAMGVVSESPEPSAGLPSGDASSKAAMVDSRSSPLIVRGQKTGLWTSFGDWAGGPPESPLGGSSAVVPVPKLALPGGEASSNAAIARSKSSPLIVRGQNVGFDIRFEGDSSPTAGGYFVTGFASAASANIASNVSPLAVRGHNIGCIATLAKGDA